jgi:hypothetical protein
MRTFVGVEDWHVMTADEFLTLLSPRNDLWRDKPTDWIYRGQANADWSLVPNAMRGGWKRFEELSVIGDAWADRSAAPPTWSQRKELIDEVLRRFREGINRSGLVVPVDYPKDYWESPGISSNAAPDITFWAQMALAQHHGLPTLFLDWTRRAFVAAYFAAIAALEPEISGSHLAVWGACRWNTRQPLTDGWAPHFYDPPAATNPNLHAQQGLFTIYPTDSDAPLEAYYQRIFEKTGLYYMRRITLPHSESSKLLRLLAYEGVTGATIFPGADGVVRGMLERRLWDER